MRIAELTAFHVRIPLRSTIRHASHTRRASDTLVVRCRLDNGIVGWGEGLPRAYVTGETIESALEHFRTTDLKCRLGRRFENLSEAVALAQEFRWDDLPTDGRKCFGNAARCAVELSLLDAASRAAGVPLSQVTRLVPESLAIRKVADRIRYSAAMTGATPVRQFLRACAIRYFGFHQGKVKVGVPGVDEAAMLRRVRRITGKTFDLRIDANEAWTCANFEASLRPLLPFGISAVEQPVPHAQSDCLAKFRGQIPVSIVLDESLCSVSDAHRAIERGTCDLFNIRLSKCGGFINSIKLAALAHQAGLGYQLGCQVGETGILSAAGRHFAASIGEIRYIEGSFDRFLVKERLTVEDITFGRGGYAPALAGPGLGVTIEENAVRRVTVTEEHCVFE